jgi:hypothetical protein
MSGFDSDFDSDPDTDEASPVRSMNTAETQSTLRRACIRPAPLRLWEQAHPSLPGFPEMT